MFFSNCKIFYGFSISENNRIYQISYLFLINQNFFQLHELFLNCSKVVDDVPQLLRDIDEEQLKIIYPLCSQKYKDCKQNSIVQIQELIKNDQNAEEIRKFTQEKLVTVLYYSNFLLVYNSLLSC